MAGTAAASAHVADHHGHDHDLDVTMDVDFGGMVAEALYATTRRERRSSTSAVVDSSLTAGVASQAPSASTRQRGGLVFARPRLLTRIVLVGTLCLLAGLAVMAALTAEAVGDLVAVVRADHRAQHGRVLDEPLPPDAELRDATAFADHLAARPDRSAALHLRRAELLLPAGESELALEHFRQARLTSVTGLTIDQRILEARALLRAGRTAAATDRLQALQQERLTTEQRQRVLGLLGRIYLR